MDYINHGSIRHQVKGLYRLLEATGEEREQAKQTMLRLGRRYPEIREFRRRVARPVDGLYEPNLYRNAAVC